MNAVEVEALSKRYRIGGHQELGYKTVRDAFSSLFRKKAVVEHARTFWALRDVSFEVKEGEAIGIIGRNGAGKSTLLKILSRITEPTSGVARLRGRVSSLLEVGTGFHPELTGRENIYLNGAILGMSRAEVKKHFDAIVEFAEVSTFLDTPVKRYSSGMYVRLAFAVAAHLDPEILIVDEVLAVGDVGFQRKCLDKMGEESREGRTVIFVSHNMQAVANLCTIAMILEKGSVVGSGDPSSVTLAYVQAPWHATSDMELEDRRRRLACASGDRVQLESVEVSTGDGDRRSVVTTSQAIQLTMEFANYAASRAVMVTFILYSMDGSPVFETDSAGDPAADVQLSSPGRFRVRCVIPPDLLNSGSFSVRTIIQDRESLDPLLDYPDAAHFAVQDVRERRYLWHGRHQGPIHPKLEWTAEARAQGKDTA